MVTTIAPSISILLFKLNFKQKRMTKQGINQDAFCVIYIRQKACKASSINASCRVTGNIQSTKYFAKTKCFFFFQIFLKKKTCHLHVFKRLQSHNVKFLTTHFNIRQMSKSCRSSTCYIAPTNKSCRLCAKIVKQNDTMET